jgi:hypothetical protein
MKADLQTMHDRLGTPALGPMDVFAKPESPYVAFDYRPADGEEFVRNVETAATKLGFVPSSRRVDGVVGLTMCSGSVQHRSLDVARGKGNGVISISVSMARTAC